MINQDALFLPYGFKKNMITYPFGETLDVYEGPFGHFYKIDHFDHFYVIEFAENEEAARSYVFEDTDLFDDKLPKEELYKQLRAWIEKYAFEK